MCAFRIEFIDETWNGLPLGHITLGNFDEDFDSDFSFWAPEQYQAQWKKAVSDIVSGNVDRTCLYVTMYPKDQINFVVSWPMYRQQDVVIFKNQMLFAEQYGDRFDIDHPENFLNDLRLIDDDGEKFSSWTIPVSDLQAWLDEQL